jgi:hypothetical protein
MQIRLGCQLVLSCNVATPIQVLIHPHVSRRADLATAEELRITPDRLTEVLMDQGGNRWCRFVAPAGDTCLAYETVVSDRGSPDLVVPTARQCPIEALPIDTYRYLNPSRYCDTDRLAELEHGRVVALDDNARGPLDGLGPDAALHVTGAEGRAAEVEAGRTPVARRRTGPEKAPLRPARALAIR